MKIVYDSRHKVYSPTKNDLLNLRNYIITDEKGLEDLHKSLPLLNDVEFIHCREFPKSFLYSVHNTDYVRWLESYCKGLDNGKDYFPTLFGRERVYDNFSPITKETFDVAWLSAQIALTGAREMITTDSDIVALTRPGGIHAMSDKCGGKNFFCNPSIAAEYIVMEEMRNVAILNIGGYHANATQDFFYDDPDALTLSVHCSPEECFPWISGHEWETGKDIGKGFNHNIPLPKGSDFKELLWALELVISQIIDYEPEYLIITLSMNIHESHPEKIFKLKNDDFQEIGKAIKSIKVPKLILLEGGMEFENSDVPFSLFIKGVEDD